MQAFDPLRMLRVLTRHEVAFVVIGGLAGRVWGSPTITNDLDICYARGRANLEHLAAALGELHARLRGAPADVPFQLDARALAMGDSFTFETDAGNLDCLGTPSGTNGYADVRLRAVEVDLAEDLRIPFCSLDDLLRMKRAAARPKDLIEIEILEAVREERSRDG